MIICQCNILSDDLVAEAVADMRARTEPAIITPGQVFKCCGAKFQCAGCMSHVTEIIAKSFDVDVTGLPGCGSKRTRSYYLSLKDKSSNKETTDHEGRQESH